MKIKGFSKRLALFLTFCLVFTMLPTGAFAGTGDVDSVAPLGVSGAFQVEGGASYTTLEEAAARVPNNGTITMLRDVTVSKPTLVDNEYGIVLDIDKNYILDFDGYSLSSGDNSRIKKHLLRISAGTVTLRNGTIRANYDAGQDLRPEALIVSTTVNIYDMNIISSYAPVLSTINGNITIWSGIFKSFGGNLTPLNEEGQIVLGDGSTVVPASGWKNDSVVGGVVTVTAAADVTPPSIVSVTPSNWGPAAPITGNIVITFSEWMDKKTAGTVQLNSLAPLTGGVWTNSTTYTIPYSSLEHSTTYTVNISGFKDEAANIMDAVTSGHTFTTLASAASNDLKEALRSTIASEIVISSDIALDEVVIMGANHTLIIPADYTLTIHGNGAIQTCGKTLTINGGGTVTVAKEQGAGLGGDNGSSCEGGLNLERITVNLQNSYSGGICIQTVNVGNGATINLKSATGYYLIILWEDYTLNVNRNGKINIENFKSTGVFNSGGTVHINSGEIAVGPGQSYNEGICNYNMPSSLLKISNGGLLTGTDGGRIRLYEDSKVEGVNGKFKDRGMMFNTEGISAVGSATTMPSESTLSDGGYTWDVNMFVKEGIILSTLPQSATFTEGKITGSLSVAATASNSAEVSYAWERAEWNDTFGNWNISTSIPGATSESYLIPSDLTAGKYGFYVIISAPGCEKMNTRSAMAIVTVKAPGSSDDSQVATAGELKAELEKTAAQTIEITDSFIVTEPIFIASSHELRIPSDKTLTFSGEGRIRFGANGTFPAHTLTINGGGNLVLGCTGSFIGISGSTGTLNLSSIHVTVKNYVGIGIKYLNVENGATISTEGEDAGTIISLSADGICTVNTGGLIDIRNYSNTGINLNGSKMHINGGTVTFAMNEPGKSGIAVSASGTSYGSLKYTSGTLSGSGGAAIYFNQGTKAESLSGKFSDQNHILSTSGAVTVGDYAAAPSTNGLTSGTYYWDGARFAKHVITLSSQPQDMSVTAGAISGALSVSSTASNGKTVSYQWRKANQDSISGPNYIIPGATSNTFILPSDLIEGSYYYYCVLNADGCFQETSAVATVTVNAPSGNTGSGSGSSGGGSSAPPPVVTPPQTLPGQPVTATVPVAATGTTSGMSNANIPASAISGAITRAQSEANSAADSGNGIAVALSVTMPPGSTSLTATIPQRGLQSLVTGGVTQLEISGSPVSLSLNQMALQAILNQADGDITIGMTPATGLSPLAQSIIGNRPAYKITISYTDKNGKTQNITSFGNGGAALAIPYTPGANETLGYLFGVYVDEKGNASRISGSYYDGKIQRILIPTSHLSVYGVGYGAPSARFTDVANHWAKDSIDYVVERGLFNGTSETAFAPNAPMTRGMLATALGRLAGMDGTAYTTSSFTDVKADSLFRPSIEWAYSKGIVKGIGNQQFAPDRPVTRQEIAVIIANYAKATDFTLPVIREASSYADDSAIGTPYKTAVTTMREAGIMTGSTGNRFSPKANATRGEVSSVLHRYLNVSTDPSDK